jgi:hypothetical protein
MRDDPRSPGYQIPLPPVTGGWSLTDHPAGAGSTASRPDAGCWMLDPPSRPRPIPRPRLIADERSKSLSFGRTGVPATRPLPGAFPEGAPCHNVGTPKNRPAGWRWSQHCERRHARTGALSSARRSHRLSDTRGDLSPKRSPWEPPLTMLGRGGTSHLSGRAPNIVKNGTPQKVRGRLQKTASISVGWAVQRPATSSQRHVGVARGGITAPRPLATPGTGGTAGSRWRPTG